MRSIFIILLICTCGQLLSQEFKLINAKITNIERAQEDFCGQIVSCTRYAVTARTYTQVWCNGAMLSNNEFDTVTTKLYVYYAHDETGDIRKNAVKEIAAYAAEREAWQKQYSSDDHVLFYKSFYVNGSNAFPFVSTGAEKKGDYQLLCLNSNIYKIIIVEENALGCLTSFMWQNIYFTELGKKIELGKLVENISIAKELLAKE